MTFICLEFNSGPENQWGKVLYIDIAANNDLHFLETYFYLNLTFCKHQTEGMLNWKFQVLVEQNHEGGEEKS